jgi:hypothetical protein
MTNVSEKTLYEEQVNHFITQNLTGSIYDVVIWGEELYDKKIVVYPKKIKHIPGYGGVRDKLTNAAVVYFDFSNPQFIKWIILRFDRESSTLYLPECNFNSVWIYLRKSVDLGIRIQRELGNNIQIQLSKEIVDLSLLHRSGSVADIKKGYLTYVAKELSAELIKAKGRKQSLLNDPKNIYFYAYNSRCFHDKDCDCTSNLEPEYFMASSTIPNGYEPCRICVRKMCVRKMCGSNVRVMSAVDHIVKKYGVNDDYLKKYAYEYNLKLRMNSYNELIVIGKEDTWMIRGFKYRYLTLWHNNYVRVGHHERHITEGFHPQNFDGKTLCEMFEYINEYAFEKHLEKQYLENQKEFELIREQLVTYLNKKTSWDTFKQLQMI